MSRKILLLFSLLILIFFAGYKFNFYVSAKVDDLCANISSLTLDEAINCQKQVEAELSSLKGAIKPNEDRLNQLKLDITSIIQRATQIESDLKDKEELVLRGEEKISVSKKIFEAKIREFYKRQKKYSPILVFFENKNNISQITKELTYQQKVTEEDKKNITVIVLYVKNVEQKKVELQNENNRLSSLKSSLNSQIGELESMVLGAKTYESKLVSAAASLSQRQQDLIAQRIGSLHLPTSLGGGPLVCSDDRNIDPGFGNAFAFYTYGIPHRVGMSQYGAYGRANSGQGYDQILHAYFNFDGYQKFDNITINVNDGGAVNSGNTIWSGSLAEYVKRIYEVPDSWPTDALKAQAVAAASYALSVTNNGSLSICATQSCQVFKTDPKGGNWEQAVNDPAIANMAMVQGGNPITAWFASTAGGYTWKSCDVWGGGGYSGSCGSESWTNHIRDTSGDVGNWGDLASKSFDRDSPCFYSAQGWRNEYGKSAWLKNDEVASIVNALMLSKKLGSAPDGIESWSSDKIKDEARKNGINPFNSISSTSVSANFELGKTNNITISGDAGTQNFDAMEFRNVFNLVAPANIAIVGPLFNVERK